MDDLEISSDDLENTTITFFHIFKIHEDNEINSWINQSEKEADELINEIATIDALKSGRIKVFTSQVKIEELKVAIYYEMKIIQNV